MKYPISALDLRGRARQKVPRFAFDCMEGGAGWEDGLARSSAAFGRAVMTPRILINSAQPADLSTSFLVRHWRLPFGITPLGLPEAVMTDAKGDFDARNLPAPPDIAS